MSSPEFATCSFSQGNLRAFEARPQGRRRAMHVASRPAIMAAVAAVAAASVVAVAPPAAQTPGIPVVSAETRLVDESIFNIPLNLFYDIVNIQANELHAMQFLTDNLFFAGPWFVVSQTNLWGVDPGDPTHFMSVMNFLVPYPELSGMNSSELDFNAGLGQQLWGLVAAELPISSACDDVGCAPLVPTAPITGITGIDSFLWPSQILTGQENFSLFEHWFKVPLDELNPYYFDPAFDGSTDPDGVIYPFTGWGVGDQIIPGTTTVTGLDGTVYENAMPWSGESYTLQPWVPFDNFFHSLMETPPTDGIGGTGIDSIYTNLTEISQTFQAFAAGLTMFTPFTPGSPFCPDECTGVTSLGLNYPDLIKFIGDLSPGNPVINEWLTAFSEGTANVPSDDAIQRSIELLQNAGFWDFGNPPYVGENVGGFDIGALAPMFHQLWTDLGFDPPPLAGEAATAAVDTAAPTDLGVLFAGLDPSTLWTDLSSVVAGFGTTAGADSFSQLVTDFWPQLATDFGAMLPSSVLGSF
jgi:hypothetical protein